MSNFDNNLQSVCRLLQKIGLRSSEKRADRSQLAAYIDTHKSFQWVGITRVIRRSFGRVALGAAAVCLMVGGLTYAAQDSLPGSPLYTVKTHINEPVMTTLAWSDSREAQTESTLAARRISELQELLNSNKLTTSTSENLLSRVADHTQAARREIAQLEMSAATKDDKAQELRSRLQALLAVEGEKMQNRLDMATTSSSSGKIAERAGKMLTELAHQHASQQPTTTKRATGLSSGGQAVINLLRVTTRQMKKSYGAYRQFNDPQKTPPPSELVSAAYTLESSLEHVNKKQHSQALDDLEETLDNLRAHASGRSHVTIQTSSKDVAVEVTSSTGTAEITDDDTVSDTQASAGLPTRQALHNQTIQEAIRKANDVLAQFSFHNIDSTSSPDQSTSTQATTTSSATTTQSATSTHPDSTTETSVSHGTSSTSTNDESAM
ncbi:MAG: hypothetical protein BRC25_01335 [Parcubacteria group bacterium SW_6_46_9]|nr:MAG: hypothetical protein BRC25_01335 [Parcubacteria group bacterium SW_6_46_9]